MRSRVLLLATAFVLAVPAASHAAPVCNLVKDKTGDASLNATAAAVYQVKPLDIRSYDVATGKKTLVAVLRVGSTKPADDQFTSKSGLRWTVHFSIDGAGYSFTRKLDGAGKASDSATADGAALSGVKATMTGDTVTWTAPRSAFPKLRGRGVRIGGLYADSSSPGFYDQAPDGGRSSDTTYTDGAKSCVKAA